MIPINLFTACWLLLIFINPLHSNPQNSYWVSDNVREPANRPIDSTFRTSIPKPPQYKINYNYQQNFDSPWLPLPNNPNLPSYRPAEPKYYPKNIKQTNNYNNPVKDVKNRKYFNGGQFQQLENSEEDNPSDDILQKMNILENLLDDDQSDNELEAKNTVEDRIMSEETRRVVREVSKKRPGFFWTLARIVFETYNDTRSAIKQISTIVNGAFEPERPTRRPPSGNIASASSMSDQKMVSSNKAEGQKSTTTTEEPFRLTRTGLQTLIRRNIMGLVRLFNIEWRDALNESETSVREFRKELGKQIGSHFRDNPNAF